MNVQVVHTPLKAAGLEYGSLVFRAPAPSLFTVKGSKAESL